LDRTYIGRALDASRRNLSEAARILKISRNSLMDLVKKYGL
jgi:DNA-binding NtrC family response regulator